MPINIFSTIDDPLAPSITEAHGINDLGLVAGSFFDASNHQHGFLLSGSTFTTIDVTFPGTTATEALGVNNAGTVVGVFRDASGLHGFMRFTRSRRHGPLRWSRGQHGHRTARYQRHRFDRRELPRCQRHPRLRPDRRHRHVHHVGRSRRHERHRCIRHQRCRPDRRGTDCMTITARDFDGTLQHSRAQAGGNSHGRRT